MGRLKELRKYVDSELNRMEDADKRNSAIVHLYGVSLAATIIAKKGTCSRNCFNGGNAAQPLCL